MLTEYIQRAMERAAYEVMEDGRFFATIPGLKGLWADRDTLELCRRNLIETLEDWIFISLKEGLPIPAMEGLELAPNRSLEEADA
jgi:predicted RNase H-like HicB family nuclease